MVFPCRWIVVLTVLLATGLRLAAASAADRAFDAAVKAFHDTFYERAEAQLAEFRQKHPTSPRLPEAILLQAQARLEVSNYAGAIELLTAGQNAAGKYADQYQFWLAQTCLRKGDWRAASDAFAKLLKEFPDSSRRLEAVIGEASARAALAQTDAAEWPRVIALLQETNGVFQSAASTNAAGEWVARGALLLSEALLATKNYHAAEEALQPLAKRLLRPQIAWQRQHLLCRIQLADNRPEAALQGATNLVALAAFGAQTNLQAESVSFQAGLLERLGRTNEAIAAYQQNLADGIPAERQRQALLKITELYLAQDRIPEAIETFERFLAQYPKAASADLALLTVGELRMHQHKAGMDTNIVASATTNAPAATNGLQLALAAFSTLTNAFPQSPFEGKAQLDLGWCLWLEGRTPEAQAAFQAAVERLPFGADQAKACFRLADAQFQQMHYAEAIRNYQLVIEKFAEVPEARTNLFERALSQTVRASLATNDLATATNTLRKMLAWYPDRLDTSRAMLLTGQEISLRGDPLGARKMFLEFTNTAPRSPLLPELQLAIAATYEQNKEWTNAIAQYDVWLASYPTNEARPRAEYFRAWDIFQIGETNALIGFTNLVARFPTNEFAPLAQWWVADYYYRTGNPVEAERNYKLLFQSTNWPPCELTYEAQLMAGRAAVARQGWSDARTYFTSLYNNTNGPSITLRLQALFEHGLGLMRLVDPAETNRLANCEEATRAFGRICDEYPTNELAIRAWTERANCYLQWALAKQQFDSLTNALNAFQQVIDSPQADASARSQAKVGQAVVLGKWAEQKTGDERIALRQQALSNCLDVVYGSILRTNGESPDLFWTKEAGVEAFNLAESLQAWSQAAGIYQRLTNTVWPQLPAWLEKRALKDMENLERAKTSR